MTLDYGNHGCMGNAGFISSTVWYCKVQPNAEAGPGSCQGNPGKGARHPGSKPE